MIGLHPRATVYFLLQRFGLWLLLGVWLAFAFSTPTGPSRAPYPPFPWGGLGRFGIAYALALVVILGAAWGVCGLQARAYRIELGRDGIALDHGVLSKVHETLLYGKVQDILIRRSLLERLLGLSTLVVQNAMGRPQTIPALGAATAFELRDEILRRITRSA